MWVVYGGIQGHLLALDLSPSTGLPNSGDNHLYKHCEDYIVTKTFNPLPRTSPIGPSDIYILVAFLCGCNLASSVNPSQNKVFNST